MVMQAIFAVLKNSLPMTQDQLRELKERTSALRRYL
jgi:hypothetical protein